jgi:hypothetical protein
MASKTTLALLVCCVAIGSTAAQQSGAPAAPGGDDPAALRAEIERLKSIVPGQAFAMTQIAYNFNNLWFAAHAENWPLAQFYWSETRVRLRWALRITPYLSLQVPTAPAEPMIHFALH